MKRALVFLLFLISSVVFAQTGTIVGTVRDAQSGQSLPGANVVIKELKQGTITDEDGQFVFSNVPAGEYLLEFSYLGFQTLTEKVSVEDGKSTRIAIALKPSPIPLEEIVVLGTRARERVTPVVFDNLGEDYIRQVHTVEDIPMMLTEVPNVYAYSDAGNGTGYSYLKVRGFDQTRIGVMINGIPLNDPEDHQVYWVDMPDFAESLRNIQFQRGVGSSLYGVSTFGGSLNMLTATPGEAPGLQVFSNYGSYNSRKVGFIYNSKPIYKMFQIHARLSKLDSDGYRERSATDQWAYFFSLSRSGKKSFAMVNLYGGREIVHAAWDASPESELKKNHRHNPITYSNTIDNFSQPHYELHYTYQFSPKLYWKNSFFYIRGKGYYEQKKDSRDLWEYGLWPAPEERFSDLIRQKWVLKNQYGWISEFNVKHPGGDLTVGSYLSLYNSHHWGEVEKLLNGPISGFSPDFKYYEYYGDKYYLTAFINELYRLTPKINLMANLHLQRINYKFNQGQAGNFVGPYRNQFQVDYNFFNPRIGINYNFTPNWNLFGNVSVANREPADNELYDIWQGPDDLGVPPLFRKADTIYSNGQVQKIKWSDPVVQPERLYDFELGLGYLSERFHFKANLFWMNFQNEIVPFSAVDEDGFPIRGNAPRTVHRGVELSLFSRLDNHFSLSANLAFNDNYFKKFTQFEYDWDRGETIRKDYSGNPIAGFPDLLANWRFTFTRGGFSASLHVQGVGKQYLDNANREDRTVPPYGVLNAQLRYRLQNFWQSRHAELSLSLNNLLNNSYYTAGYYDSWSQERYFYPAAEFNLIGGLRVFL